MARIKELEKLKLKEIMFNFDLYKGLPDGLIQLPIPEKIRIKDKDYPVPQTLEEFCKMICYGQRLFLTKKEDNDFGIIIRVMDGYYYPIVTGGKWDEDMALRFGNLIINCNAKELYPVANHLLTLIAEMTEREQKLLYREPSKMELAAGIEKLNVFSEMTSLDFLRDAMKCTVPEVLLTPYNECLVRFMIAKENAEFQERYFDLMKKDNEPKSKFA
jgi:hypothetical protein